MKWYENKLSNALNIKYPIIQAPMASAASVELASEVSNAGGLGSLGLSYHKFKNILPDYKKILSKTNHTVNLNFFTHKEPVNNDIINKNFKDNISKYYKEHAIDEIPDIINTCETFNSQQLNLLLQMNPKVVSFHFGLPKDNFIKEIKKQNIYIISSATTVEEAIILENSGADAIIAQGFEAGGHRGTFHSTYKEGEIGLFSLLPQIVNNVNVPVIAAGGIADGRGIAAALMLGAQGVQLGTAFLKCPEASVHPLWKKALENSGSRETRITSAFTGRPARGIVNHLIKEMEGKGYILPDFPKVGSIIKPLANSVAQKGDESFLSLWAGQSAPMSKSLPAKDLVQELTKEVSSIFDDIKNN
jgi:nitronate monooxygenase